MAAIHLLDFYFAGWVQLAFRKKHMKRGLWAFGGGVVVSLVTAIVLPNDRVRYGVLTLIGSCILIWILLDKVLKKSRLGLG